MFQKFLELQKLIHLYKTRSYLIIYIERSVKVHIFNKLILTFNFTGAYHCNEMNVILIINKIRLLTN